jgi:hypothetical protein
MRLSESELALWEKISAVAAPEGTPKAVCSTITPFPFWGVIAAIVIFIPLALIVGFFLRRQAIVAQGGGLFAYELSLFAARPRDDGTRIDAGPAPRGSEADRRGAHLPPAARVGAGRRPPGRAEPVTRAAYRSISRASAVPSAARS